MRVHSGYTVIGQWRIIVEPGPEVGGYRNAPEGRDEEMKYIGLWEMESKDMDVNIKKYQEMLAAREKGSEKFPTQPISDNYVFTGQYKGFILYGDDTTEEQLVNVSIHFKDTMKWTFKSITEVSKTIELYMKSK